MARGGFGRGIQIPYLCFMHLKGLYEVSGFLAEDESFSATIIFDAKHAIFQGHFPGQPVVPGVCLIHIVKMIATMISGEAVHLTKGSNIKFLQLIDPRKSPVVIIKGKYSGKDESVLTISATISNEEVVFFKFKGLFS
jgi:3-hydroxyacyl-[acyl-carrier-protein] dehydratase